MKTSREKWPKRRKLPAQCLRMKVQKLTIADYERTIDLWSRAGLTFKPHGRDSQKAMAGQMTANPQFFRGAFIDTRLVGIVIIGSDNP